MSLVHNLVGTGMLVVGSMVGLGGLARSCGYVGDYEPLTYARMDCSRGLRNEAYCNKIDLLAAEQNKKVASWAGFGLAGIALAYAGHKIRERGSPSQ